MNRKFRIRLVAVRNTERRTWGGWSSPGVARRQAPARRGLAPTVGLALLLPGAGFGQSVIDYEHNWAVGDGSAADDFGRGVALWHDGTACQLSEMATGPGGDSEMKITLSWRDSGGAIQTFSRVDGGTVVGGQLFPRDITAGNNFVDMGSHPPYRTARMHSVGSFFGEVEIGHTTLESGTGGTTVAAFVSRDGVGLDGSPSFIHDWATAFTSDEVIEALTAASSPRGCRGGDGSASVAGGSGALAGPTDPALIARPTCPSSGQPDGRGMPESVAVGGYFRGTATFPTESFLFPAVQRTAASGTDDGYVAIVKIEDGQVVHTPDLSNPQDRAAILVIPSVFGNTRVTGVAIDPKDHAIAVTGWFDASDADFDPNSAASFLPPAHAGSHDIFVAKYEPDADGQLFLRWLYVSGTQYDDEGASVAFDSSGAVYATGWKGDAWGNGDLWIARFAKQTGGTFPRSINPAWQHNWATDSADVRGLDVAVDHLDRAVATGRYGYTNLDIPTYCMDFDPGAGTDSHCTNGRSDIFVMRFRPNSLYDGGYRLGGYWDDVGAAVATEPRGSGRIAIGGTFGIGAAPGYTVDFDPASGGDTLQSQGGADSFASALDPVVPDDGVLSQVSVVFDNSGSVDETKYVALMAALRSKLKATGNVPTDGSVVLGLVVYAQDAGVPFMPWTRIDSAQTLSAFANRLAQQALPPGGENHLVRGIETAGEQFLGFVVPGAYRHLVAIVEDEALGDPRTEIDGLFTQGVIDQSSGIATFTSSTHGDGRDWILEEVAESVAQVPVPHPEDNLGMGAQIPAMEHADFPVILDRFIKRVTVCPGDFDRDGFVDVGDDTAFHVAATQFDPYADWNFNDSFEVPGTDEAKFDSGWSLGCGAP